MENWDGGCRWTGNSSAFVSPFSILHSEGAPMPFVIYATPFFSENAVRNIAALLDLPDLRVGVISQAPQEELAAEQRSRLAAHRRVDDILDAAQLTAAARGGAQCRGRSTASSAQRTGCRASSRGRARHSACRG